MFHNVGKKIKKIAEWVGIMLPLALVVVGLILVFIGDDLDILGWSMAAAAPVCILSAIFIYGFGEIVDTAIYLREGSEPPATKEAVASQPRQSAAPAVQTALPKSQELKSDIAPYVGKKFCSDCRKLFNDPNVTACPTCGSKYLGMITRTNAASIIPNIVEQ